MSIKYTKEQFEQIKQRCPKCIFPRHLKDGSVSFMVRITTMMGDKRTLITTPDLREAKQILADYQTRQPISRREAPNALEILDEIVIPDTIYNYLCELPPHEIAAEEYIFMPTADGNGYIEISPEMQAEFLRRQLGISQTAVNHMPTEKEPEQLLEDQDNDGPIRDYSSAFFPKD